MPFRIRRSTVEGERTGDETDRVDRVRFAGLPQQPPHQPLEGAVEAVADPADLATQVTDQPDALRRDRRPNLGRLGDPLDQLLDLVGSEQPIPGMVDELGIERPCCGPFDRRAGERPLERLLGRFGLEHAEDRALDRRALERPHDRLLGRASRRRRRSRSRRRPVRRRERRSRVFAPAAAGRLGVPSEPDIRPDGRAGAGRNRSNDTPPTCRRVETVAPYSVFNPSAPGDPSPPAATMRACAPRSSPTCTSGFGSGADLLRRESFRARLLEAIEGVDRLVLLGDVLELRDRPLREALDAAAPAFAELAEALARCRAGDRSRQPRPPSDRALARASRARRRRRRSRSSRPASRSGSRSRRMAAARRPDRAALRVPGHLAARRRLRHPRPLPRPPPDRADTRAARGRGGRAGARDPLRPAPDPLGAAGRARPAPRRRVRARPDPGVRAPLRPRAGDGRRAPRRG